MAVKWVHVYKETWPSEAASLVWQKRLWALKAIHLRCSLYHRHFQSVSYPKLLATKHTKNLNLPILSHFWGINCPHSISSCFMSSLLFLPLIDYWVSSGETGAFPPTPLWLLDNLSLLDSATPATKTEEKDKSDDFGRNTPHYCGTFGIYASNCPYLNEWMNEMHNPSDSNRDAGDIRPTLNLLYQVRQKYEAFSIAFSFPAAPICLGSLLSLLHLPWVSLSV